MNKYNEKNILYYILGITLFIIACVLQQTDDFVQSQHISKLMSLLAQCIFFGIIVYWGISIISRVSDRNIRVGLTIVIILMASIMLIRLIKYNVLFDTTAERYAWYAYYIPHCLTPVVILLTINRINEKKSKKTSSFWGLLFLPAALLIFLVFTNDLHEQVFSFANGLEDATKIYKWEWGYYVILSWITGLYLTIGILLFIKCRNSFCRKKAWIPLVLFVSCITCCILREVFNPLFIKMPETVVFSVLIVCESLIQIGLIPSNKKYARFFDVANISAMIANVNHDVELSSKNAPEITREQVIKTIQNGEIALSKDIILKAKAIKGGEVFWTEDMSVINKINDSLVEINATLAEEIDIIVAENRIREQRSKIEEQKKIFNEIFNISQPHLKIISERFAVAKTKKEIDDALRVAVVQGVFLKRRSNLMLIKREGKVSISELVYALKEATDALSFCNVSSSVFATINGDYPIEQIKFIFDCFIYCIESSLSDLTACLVRLSENDDQLSCRIVIDSVNNTISKNWCNKECNNLGAIFKIEKSEETIFATLTFGKEVLR